LNPKPFEHRVDYEVLKNEYGISPRNMRKYRRKILTHHISQPWHSKYTTLPNKVNLTLEHHMMFNILCGDDFFKGIEGKGEHRYFLAKLTGDKALNHPFMQHYYTILNLTAFFQYATESKPWFSRGEWRLKQMAKLKLEYLYPFTHFQLTTDTFNWGKSEPKFWQLMTDQFTIIDKKFKRSLDIFLN